MAGVVNEGRGAGGAGWSGQEKGVFTRENAFRDRERG